MPARISTHNYSSSFSLSFPRRMVGSWLYRYFVGDQFDPIEFYARMLSLNMSNNDFFFLEEKKTITEKGSVGHYMGKRESARGGKATNHILYGALYNL